ncbi:MAG: hypothetical protein J6866_01395, partial [Victivallales bacterium]|nr:hypothetical protein [Victivallales bacterium]
QLMARANGQQTDIWREDIAWNGKWKLETKAVPGGVDYFMAIPAEDFASPDLKDTWFANFCRDDVANKESSCVYPMKVGNLNFRDIKRWAELVFPHDVAAAWRSVKGSTVVEKKAETVKVVGRLNYYMNEPEAKFRITKNGKTEEFTLDIRELPIGTNVVTVGGEKAEVVKRAYDPEGVQVNHFALCVERHGRKLLPFAANLGWLHFQWASNEYFKNYARFYGENGFRYLTYGILPRPERIISFETLKQKVDGIMEICEEFGMLRMNFLMYYDFTKPGLTPEEVKALWKNENNFGLPPMEENLFPASAAVAASLPAAEVLEGGALRLHAGKETFLLNTLYAYPLEPNMGYNLLVREGKGCEEGWNPVVSQDGNGVTVTAQGAFYKLERRVQDLGDGRLRLTDTITNLTPEDQAVVFSHYLQPQAPLADWYLHGEEQSLSASENRMAPCNPTGWFSTGDDALAWVVEDDIFRCHLEASVKLRDDNRHLCTFGSRRIGVPAGQKRVFEMTFYSMKGDFFDFLNRLRKDWQVPEVTLPGPFITVRTMLRRSEVYQGLAADPEAMKAYFTRRKARTFTINPWFNYWDGMAFKTKEDFRDHVKNVMKTIRQAIPDAMFLASMETYTYYVTEEDFTTPAPEDFSWNTVTPGTIRRVMESPFRDSATLTHNGKIALYPDKDEDGAVRKGLKLQVHPVIGNFLYKRRLEEYQFLFDEVGLDGVYQDMFGYASTNATIHTGWDGFSISVSPNGKIASKCIHLGPLTAPARANWLRYILGRNKIALCNFGAPTTRELQTIPYMNFCEAAGNGIGRQNLDAMPPEASGVVMNQLSTPLGYGPHRTEEEDGPRLLARVRGYLRHGALYVHTSVRNFFPSDGPKGGEYGPINHSYPITPVELHRGWVKGRERIVSCVSYKTTWDRQEQPVALRFDANGREMPVGDGAVITGKPGAWEIAVNIKDWLEFLIIE